MNDPQVTAKAKYGVAGNWADRKQPYPATSRPHRGTDWKQEHEVSITEQTALHYVSLWLRQDE